MTYGLYIITHKEIKNIFPDDRKIMMVGAVDKVVPNGYYTDCNSKDNISNKNKYYCELTGLYEIIKSDTSDVLGLEHYRRAFIKHKHFVFRYPFLKEKDISKLLKKVDIIVPKKFTFKNTVFENYTENHIISDWELVGKIIKEHYPDYYESYIMVCQSNDLYICNMFIAKRNIIEEYTQWLFDILSQVEQKINITERDAYQQRVFGFLSERLFTVYLHKHREYKVYEKPIIFLESSPFQYQLNRVFRKLKLKR